MLDLDPAEDNYASGGLTMKIDKTFSLSEEACKDLEILAMATDQTQDEALEWIIEEADHIFFTVLEKAKNIQELQEAAR